MGDAPTLHPLPKAQERLGIGRTTLYALLERGEIDSVKIGRRRLISEASLRRYIQRLGTRKSA